jgi:single-stranded-DNA-specific exonuclease
MEVQNSSFNPALYNQSCKALFFLPMADAVAAVWQLPVEFEVPDWFLPELRAAIGDRLAPGADQDSRPALSWTAQLLWHRNLLDCVQALRQGQGKDRQDCRTQLAGFLDPAQYTPTSPFAFGEEMAWAVARLVQARSQAEKVAIWGDFDADGVTATAVLWEGLGQFFPADHLTYHIPNRLYESHGLAIAGLETLAQQGVALVVTCDTGSSNLAEILQARDLGLEVIITDHHTLPPERPPVAAILNPRSLPADHPLAHLSGVAVAFKLVEALYEQLPDVPRQPLDKLLDLVAIGLIADLVSLTGDCRYLAQRGLEQLQRNLQERPPSRPGVARLLDLCKANGDRPTDISFGIGPRINAISRIYGDARFAVELLTSTDPQRCRALAEKTELANARRKDLQRNVANQVRSRLETMDLSTTSVIVLESPQWPVGVLGLVAAQIAQEYGRPTILLNTDGSDPDGLAGQEQTARTALARGSARSVQQIDLYQLVQGQAHLLTSFGGHPYAAGLTLPVANIPLFAEAINRELRQQMGDRLIHAAAVQADLTVTVADLGKALFRELKLLEPYGMGNPVPQLLIQNCWFTDVHNENIYDRQRQKLRYIKTEFQIWDESVKQGFPGVWWEHYRDELPAGRCDAIAELDFNTYHRRYEIRLVAVRSHQTVDFAPAPDSVDWLEDWREAKPECPMPEGILPLTTCPRNWDDLRVWGRRARREGKRLALAYAPPTSTDPITLWQTLVGIAKYLSRTGKTATRQQWLGKLGVDDRTLQVGVQSLGQLGFAISSTPEGFQVTFAAPNRLTDTAQQQAMDRFLQAVQEEQFRRRYFYHVPLRTLKAMLATPQVSDSP